MTANVVWIIAIIQRPAIRWRTSSSASSCDSPSKRSASSSERPIVFPSRIPETDSDSCDEARDVGERLLRRRRDLAPLVADAPRQEHEHRDQREREERRAASSSAIIADHRRDHRRRVRDDRRGGARDDALDAADVVRDARLHLAGARAREEREREPLQVAEDRRAQVVHHALADLVREERLPDAEHAGDDGDRDHPAGGERELRRVVSLDRLQHAAQEERRDDAERRRRRG